MRLLPHAVEANLISQVVEVLRQDSGSRGEQTVRVAGTYACPRAACRRPSLVFIEFIIQLGGYRTLRGIVFFSFHVERQRP